MAPPKTQEGGHHVFCPPKAPKKLLLFIVHFFRAKVNLGSSKNSGLNPWSFEFWRYPRLEPAPSCPPPLKPAAGSASDDTFHIISLIKKHLPLLLI